MKEFLTKIDNNKYTIDLYVFDNLEEFNYHLYSFLNDFSKIHKNINEDCLILKLGFENKFFEREKVFLFPYIDKDLSFTDIYLDFGYHKDETLYFYIEILLSSMYSPYCKIET
jgi:hypothetical protein